MAHKNDARRCPSSVAAWLNIARQALRPAARRPQTWRARLGFALVFAMVGAWAAIAPQAGLSLGERLRLSFHALTTLCVILAATSSLRHQTPIVDDRSLNLKWRDRTLGRLVSNATKSAQDLVPAIPFFLFLAALQVISPLELIASFSVILLILLTACAVNNFQLLIPLILIASLCVVTRRLNYFETAICVLFAFHLGLKAFITWNAIRATSHFQSNLMHEAVTPIDAIELATARRRLLWQNFGTPIISLACANLIILFFLVSGASVPATLEQKLALGFALFGGAALLFIDASALAWRGLLSGMTTHNVHQSFTTLFATIIGIPWAVAWGFSAMHAGEAFTLNEAAAYFFLWIALSFSISWFARASAKDKLHREFREILSEQ